MLASDGLAPGRGQMGRVYREESRLPAELVDDDTIAKLAIAGTPDECAAGVRRLVEAGADEIAFFPFPSDTAEQSIRRIADDLLPWLRGA